jgi:hypothetical protein
MRNFDGGVKGFGRKSLLAVSFGLTACYLATCFSVTDAHAQATRAAAASASANGQSDCPGVTVTGPAGVACGANAGVTTAGNIASNTETAIEYLRKNKKYLNPMYTKAEPAENNVSTSAWITGTYLNENQSGSFQGADIGSKTQTWSWLAGYEAKFTLPAERTLTLGLFGGEDFSTMTMPLGDQIKTNAPNLGVYAEYDVGDSLWSELYYTHSWLQNSALNCAAAGAITECSQATATSTDEVEGNVYYRFNPNAENGQWWWEPTVGFVYDHTTETLGVSDDQVTRLQGGANFGTSFMWGDVKVMPKLSALLFSDVSVTGGTTACCAVATDQGQLWGKAVARLKFSFKNNFSTAVEAQVYGTNGTEKIIDYQLLGELRYKWGGADDED